jgi:hypothetical protein
MVRGGDLLILGKRGNQRGGDIKNVSPYISDLKRRDICHDRQFGLLQYLRAHYQSVENP